MSLKPVSGKIESQELNDNFSYLNSEKLGRNDEIGMSQLDQEVREAFTGGAVPVVGENSVREENIKDHAVGLSKVSFTERSWNLINPEKVLAGYRIDESGKIIEHPNYKVSNLIDVSNVDLITCSLTISLGVFLDDSDNIISTIGPITSYTPTQVPNDAIKFRMTTGNKGSPFYVWVGNGIRSYVPYYYLNKEIIPSEYNHSQQRLYPEYEFGSIDGDTGEDNQGDAGRLRIRTSMMRPRKDLKIKLDGVLKCSLRIYDLDGNYLGSLGRWLDSDYILRKGYQYRVQIAEKNDSRFGTSLISNLDKHVVFIEGYSDPRGGEKGRDIFGAGKKYVTIMARSTPSAREIPNTLESIKTSKLSDVWGVEVDIRRTKDNDLVLWHDETILDTGLKVEDLTVAEIKEITIPTDNYEHNVKIPTLDEALKKIFQYGLVPWLDVKGADEGYIDLLVTKLKEHKMENDVILINQNINLLNYARTLLPTTWFAGKRVIRETTAESDIAFLNSIEGNVIFQPEYGADVAELLTWERVKKYHSAGYLVRGYDFIFTNDPSNEFRTSQRYWAKIETADGGSTWWVGGASVGQEINLERFDKNTVGIKFSNLEWVDIKDLSPSISVTCPTDHMLLASARLGDIGSKQLLIGFNYIGEQAPDRFSLKVDIVF